MSYSNCNPCDPCGTSQSAAKAAAYARQANTSAVNAANSATNAENTWLEFNALYLGSFAVAPMVDNEGNPLQEGALYFNSGSNQMFVWQGGSWIDFYFDEFTPFLATGTTAARSLENRFADVVNVKDFGAVGDGVADDTAAIQAAINYASGGKAKVYIPDGVYKITSGLTIPDDGITIEGDGFGRSLSVSENIGTRIVADFSSGWVITCNQACFTLRNIEIYGSDSVRWTSAGSVDGTKGAIYIRNGVTSTIEKVLIYQEPGIGIYLSKECPSTKLTQVTVEYCKGHAYYIDDGALNSTSGYEPCGIITLDTCRAARIDCCAMFAGDPNNESGTGLAAYRLYLLNNEFFYCGGNTALSPFADYVIRIYGDNCTITGSAISGPDGQSGGNSTTQGTLPSNGSSASLVSGIYVDGRGNSLLNNRYIRPYRPAINVASNSSNTTINGVEARHTSGSDFNSAIFTGSGFDGINVSNVGSAQVSDPIDLTLLKVSSSSQPINSITKESIYLFSNGDGLYLDPTGGTFSYYDGTTQLHRFATDGTFRSLAEVRPINNNTASLGIAGARWSEVFAVNGTINTSDANYKQQIQDIPEAVLRAWGKVSFKQYKFNHAVDSKGESARWHNGLIAQDIKAAFESEGLNAFEYGVLCYNEWNDELDDKGNVLNPAGKMYSVRYDEAYALESAYIRWKISQL